MKKGGNYGWPFVEGFCDSPTEEQFCKDSQVIEPHRAFTPTLAIAGIEYYDGKKFPQWKNSLLVASLRSPFFSVFPLNVNQDSVLDWWKYPIIETSRLRSVCVSPDGRIFLGKSQGDHYGTKNNKDNAIIEVIPQTVNIQDDIYYDESKSKFATIKNEFLTLQISSDITSVELYNSLGEQLIKINNTNVLGNELQIPFRHNGLLIIVIHFHNGTTKTQTLLAFAN